MISAVKDIWDFLQYQIPTTITFLILMILAWVYIRDQKKTNRELTDGIKEIKKDVADIKTENAKTEYATVSTFGNGKKQEYWDNKRNWTK